MIEVILAAPQLTVQDLGRRGSRHLGVPRCGMLDTMALQRANLLLGNPVDAAGLEITFGPTRLKACADHLIVLMGADLNARFEGGTSDADRPLAPGFVHLWRAGQTLKLAAPRGAARACLAVAGGIDVPVVLGSRSTDLNNRFGGLEGRSLTRGDRLPVGARTLSSIPAHGLRQPAADGRLRVVPGPDYEALNEDSVRYLHHAAWKVSESSSRMGFRLQGPRIAIPQADERVSFGVMPGQIQIPPDGQPILLAADAQTTGGYPCVASVIGADLWQLAYLTPGTHVSLQLTDLTTALELQHRRQSALRRLAEQLGCDTALSLLQPPLHPSDGARMP